VKPQIELAHIPTADIDIEDGHNPRGTVAEDADLKALAHTIGTVGLLQTLRVRRQGDRYVVIAGERRYHAAVLAGQDTVPAMIEPETEDTEESRTARLLAAYVENHARVNFDPIAEANVFAALLEGGLTVAGIAEQIGGPKNTKQYRNARAHINEHLAMLTLPPTLYPQIADRAIPKKAVPALVRLAEIMPALAELAAARVLSPPEGLYPADALTWDEFITSPVSICSRHFDGYGGELPPGVYDVGEEYDIADFALTARAREAQAEVIQIEGRDPFDPHLRFGKRDAEQAAALNALACDDVNSRARS
jgi:ParB/RepB/Spo0J family partition protein